MQITPLTPAFGAKIEGVKLGELSDAEFATIQETWFERRGLLAFPGQHISDDDLLRFSRRIGELDSPPNQENGRQTPAGFPDIYVISNVLDTSGRPIGALGDGEAVWHTDMSYEKTPPLASMLTAREIPTQGGDTWFTDMIGLHAVFGAFVMGAAMPRGIMVRDLCARIQPLAVALLLPLFFTYSGLNTKIGLLNTWFLWGMCLAVLVAAVMGKWLACTLAAKATGISNREAMGIGILMNARGLMELIIINIGLQRGIISEGLFATLVIMAVVTTLMASPIFERLVGSGTYKPEPDV
jgi:hypothetical protein